MTRRLNILAWAILASVFLGMSIYLLLNPTRTGVVPNYRFASMEWWHSQSMYPGGTHKYLYAPSFAVFFTPLNIIRPEILGELLWRALGFGLFAYALYSISGDGRQSVLSPAARHSPSAFLFLVLLAVPASLASLNNGQTNLPLSACLVLAARSMWEQKWNRVAFWLNLSLLLKPIALAPWLLAFAVVSPVRLPLLGGGAVVFGCGLLNQNFAYAMSQWVEFFQKLLAAYAPVNLRVSDLFGAMERAGVLLPPLVIKGIRAAACLGALGYVWHSLRHRGIPGAAWALWVGCALIFTLFNPRAETNGYVLVSPLLALAGVNYWRGGRGERWKAVVLAGTCLGLMCDGMGLWIYRATDVWFKPLIVLLVSPLLLRMPESWKGGGTKSV